MGTNSTPPKFTDLDPQHSRELHEMLRCFFYETRVTAPLPEKLYQYKRFNENTWAQLQNGYIWCSKSTTFNDPFDSILSLPVLRSILEKIHQGDNTQLNETTLKKTYMMFDEHRSHMRVSCLTPHNGNLLMWAHYADSHKGICIQYNQKDLEIPQRTFCIAPVIYTNDYSGLKRSIRWVRTKDNSGNDVIRFTNNNNLSLILAIVKGKAWEYEEEWRVFSDEMNFEKDKYFVPWPVEAVYLGMKLGDEEVKKIIELGKANNFAVFRSVPATSHVGLEFQPV